MKRGFDRIVKRREDTGDKTDKNKKHSALTDKSNDESAKMT